MSLALISNENNINVWFPIVLSQLETYVRVLYVKARRYFAGQTMQWQQKYNTIAYVYLILSLKS